MRPMEPRFAHREEAARLLADALVPLALVDPVVLALPRGGVPVGAVVARALHAPLDLVLVRKIGAPGNPELAVAATTNGPHPVLVTDEATMAATGATHEWVLQQQAAQLQEIERRRQRYLGGRGRVPLAGRTAVVVDDGIATGTTARAALRAVRQCSPAALVLAVPVAPPDVLRDLASLVDRVVCLSQPAWFHAVGAHYVSFPQVGDEEVVRLMKAAAPLAPASPAAAALRAG